MVIDSNIIFAIFTFVVILAVILIADSLTTAVFIISMLTNFLVISGRFGKISRESVDISITTPTPLKSQIDTELDQIPPLQSQIDTELPLQPQNPQLYGHDYDKWHSHHVSYGKCYNDPQPIALHSCSENTANVDNAITLMARRRFRDAKCSDGWASKNANYYKYHYNTELKDAEQKQWWGNNEF